MELYHYTTLDGFLGIAEHGKYWVSSFDSMNDSAEFYAGLEIIRRIANKLSSRFMNREVAEQISFVINDTMHERIGADHFVFSATTSKDNATMYGSYLGERAGVCLEIEPVDSAKFEPVIYSRFEFAKRAYRLIHLWYNTYADRDASKFHLVNMLPDIAKLCLLFKDASFRYECEYRCIFIHKSFDVCFRSNAKRIISYIQVDANELCKIKLVIVRSAKQDEDSNKRLIIRTISANQNFRDNFTKVYGDSLQVTSTKCTLR